MSVGRFLRTVVAVLDEAGVPYMLTGSLAAAAYATPRATQDVDVVIEVDGRGLERVVDGMLREGYYVDPSAARDALRTRGQFNAIDPESGWKVDVIVRKDRPFSEAEFDRRRAMEVFGVQVMLASLEDIVIAKLEWSELGDSELQRRDVRALLERAGDRLDRTYVERWVTDLGLRTQWAAITKGL